MDISSAVLIALGLTVVAGLSTGIGSAIAYFIRTPKLSYLSFSMGLSAGVMVYVSFVELLAGAVEDIGDAAAVAGFFLGIAFIAVIDILIPEAENPHEYKGLFDAVDKGNADARAAASPPPVTPAVSAKGSADIGPTKAGTGTGDAGRITAVEDTGEGTGENPEEVAREDTGEGTGEGTGDDETSARELVHKKAVMRAGMFTALAIAIHNFPEGLATFGTALVDPQLGAFIAFAIAIHNIPEGISVSMPIYYATGDRKKAFWYSFMSGVAEPVGAIIGFALLMPFMSDALLGGLLAFVAGIMVYVSLDELLPMAHKYGHNHTVIVGVVMGMLIMALSLLML